MHVKENRLIAARGLLVIVLSVMVYLPSAQGFLVKLGSHQR